MLSFSYEVHYDFSQLQDVTTVTGQRSGSNPYRVALLILVILQVER